MPYNPANSEATSQGTSQEEDRIRNLEREIEETRHQLDERVDELSRRLKPSYLKEVMLNGASEKLSHARSRISSKVSENYDRFKHVAQDKYESGRKLARDNYRDNPFLGCGLAFGAGMILGSMIPVSELEQRKLGPQVESLKDEIDERAAEVIEVGREKLEQQGHKDSSPKDVSADLTGGMHIG